MLTPWIYFLKADEQLLIETPTQRRVVNGPGVVVTPPLTRARRRQALILGPRDYLRVRDKLSGELRNVLGPTRYFLGADEEVVEQQTVIPLKRNQYLRLIDERTGAIRVERGEQSVVLAPTEAFLEEPCNGVNVDAVTAVLVRDMRNGALELITTPQVFVPAPHQEIAEIRRQVVLEDHEAVVVKQRDGGLSVYRGDGPARAFFLEPHSTLVQFRWSSGIHKDRRELRITHLDLRPKFMWYEFEVRTQDNVELVLGLTFFWQIVDVERMLRVTDDAPGDVCSHARSDIIQSVSQVSLERFLAAFNEVVGAAVLGAADPFYAERGVSLHAVEVRSVACKDAATQRTLQEIIQETTNRLNRLQKQESENEVRLRQLGGEITAEELRAQLMEVRRAVQEAEARIVGGAEGERVRAFLAGLGDELSPADKLAIFNTLRKQEALSTLSAGRASLFFTPEDVDLRIQTGQ
jgi:regulator of protease activity HflC (stomatin/prohibitin superfamily)